MKQKIEQGKYISLTYEVRDVDGSIVEQNNVPVGYIFGADSQQLGVIDPIIEGKVAGDEVTSEISPEKGFGESDPNLIFTDELKNVPPQFYKIGAEVQMKNDKGEAKVFYVSKIEEGKITLDGNHPLAGQTLSLRIKILDVRDATEEDMKSTGTESTDGNTLN